MVQWNRECPVLLLGKGIALPMKPHPSYNHHLSLTMVVNVVLYYDIMCTESHCMGKVYTQGTECIPHISSVYNTYSASCVSGSDRMNYSPTETPCG